MASQQQQQRELAQANDSYHRNNNDNNNLDTHLCDAGPDGDVAILESSQLAGQLVVVMSSTWGSRQREHDSPMQFEAMVELRKNTRVSTLLLVLPICYFLSCADPQGIEPAISAGGPLLTLVSIVVYPLVFCLPLSMIVAELCTAFPDDGGSTFAVFKSCRTRGSSLCYLVDRWVCHLGQECLWSFLVVLGRLLGVGLQQPGHGFGARCQGLKNAFGAFESPAVEYLVKVTIVVALSLPTLFGVKLIARTTFLFTVLAVVPSLLVVIKCFSQADHFDKLTEIRKVNSTSLPTTGVNDVDGKGRLTTVFWKYDGIYFVSLFGGQVANPAFTYPRVVFINLALMVLTYAVPSVAMVAADKLDWHLYEGGTILNIAKLTGGSFLHGFELMSVICSNAGMFLVTTFATCYQVNGMAENALIPEVFSKRHYFFETPYYALLLNVVPVLFLMAFDLDVLVQSSNCFSGFVQILIFASALKLRVWPMGTFIDQAKYRVASSWCVC